MPVTLTALPKQVTIATALCDVRDLQVHRDPATCHQVAQAHRDATGHRVTVFETTTTTTSYEATP